jgi:hypothetical protein
METIVEDLIEVSSPVEARTASTPRRAITVLAALALVVGGLVLARGADAPAPTTNIVTNVEDGAKLVDGASVVGKSLGFGSAAAQIGIPDIRLIVCPILNALATGPLGGLIGPIINQLRLAFGCISQ